MLISARVDATSELDAYVPRIAAELKRGENTVNGTMLFADVSGFTALTERLASTGREGAEELVGIIDSLFTDLLDTAAELGGDLLKFGGDALLLFFTGEDHAARAAAAAVRMQRRVKSVQTSVGRVRLRMSAGIHSGDFTFVVAGSTHQEVVALGPAITETLSIESAAEGGQVLAGKSTARLLDDSLLGPRLKYGRRRLLRGPRVATQDLGPPPEGSQWIAPVLREHLSVRPDAEHRLVCIVFMAVWGLDDMFGWGDDVAGPAGRALGAVQDTFASHGITFLATDAGPDGFRMLGCAGAPTSAEDDAERALRAAREAVDAALAAVPDRIRIGAGVHRGYAFAARVGSPSRATYAVMGDVTNTAARLMVRCRTGEVLATREVLAASRTRFRTAELEPFAAKGKAAPVVPILVLDPIGRTEDREEGQPIVGREAELAAIREAEGVVVVVGDAGLGKSRLVQEALPDAIRIGMDPYTSSNAYAATSALLRQLAPDGAAAAVRAAAPDLAPWTPLIALAAGQHMDDTPEVGRLDPAQRPVRLAEVTATLICALGSGRTILVEDAHWMDESSVATFEQVARRAVDANLTLVATRRPEGGWTPKEATLITLEPLTSEAIERLAREALPGRLLPHDIAGLIERSGGNPLFVLELTTALARAQEGEALPDSLESLLAARIDALPRRARDVLRVASVAGQQFGRDLVETAMDEMVDEETWSQLDEFIRADGEGAMRFQHALVQTAAYESLTFRQRRAHHLRIGTALEKANAGAEILSLHFDAAGDAERAWKYSIEAADAAREAYAHPAAAELYSRALRSSRPVTRTVVAQTYERLGDTLSAAGDRPAALVAFIAGQRLTRNYPSQRARLILREAHTLDELGRAGDSLRRARAGSRIPAESRDERVTRIRLIGHEAKLARNKGELARSIRLAEQAIVEARSISDWQGVAHNLALLHVIGIATQDPRRDELADEATRLFDNEGVALMSANVLNNRGYDAQVRGDWVQAQTAYERARTLHLECGHVVQAAVVANNLGEVYMEQGRFGDAVALLAEALDTLEAAQSGLSEYVRGNLERATGAAADTGVSRS